jgi:PAS domain-containing protein
LRVRTTGALGRLAELERRAERGVASSTTIVRPALKELTAALEELRIANEQLEEIVEELGASRGHVEAVAAQHAEFVSMVPVASVWTNPAGTILEANQAAAALLNVARQRLPGKPLMLFIADRPLFFDALASLRTSEQPSVELRAVVRPRERRPRTMRLMGHRLEHDSRWCWFLMPEGPALD